MHVSGLAHYPWREEQLVIVGPPQGPDAAHDLAHGTWLVREAGSGTREVSFEILDKLGVTPERRIEIGSNEGIARAVASGLGIAMLPYAVVEDLLALNKVVRLRSPTEKGLSRMLYRVERRDRPPSPAVLAFLDILSRPN